MVRVMFVCLGNICRSPLAEGVMRHLVAQAGLSDAVHIESSGTGNWHVGEPPDPRSVSTALQHTVDLSGQRAQHFVARHLDRFDEVRAMDASNLRQIRRLMGRGALANVGLFLDDAPGHAGEDVPDPYYGGPGGFEQVYQLVEAGCRGLLDRLRAEGRLR